jgi:non-specific protein-tyrosine kinase
MEFRYYASLLWRWAWLVILAALVSAAVSLAVSMSLPRLYSATTTLMVGSVLQSANPQATDLAVSQQLAQTYVQFVKREPILRATVDALQLGIPWSELANQVNARAVPETQLLQISVIDSSPQRAEVIADEVARQLILGSPTPAERQQAEQRQFLDAQLADLQGKITDAVAQIKTLESRQLLETSASGIQDVQGQIAGLQQKVTSWQGTYATLLANRTGNVNALSVVEPASASRDPISPNVPLNLLVAAAVGCALATLAILLMDYLDDSLRTPEEVGRVLRTPCLATIARFSTKHLVAIADPQSPIAEDYRMLRANVRFATADCVGPVVLVTSGGLGEGKTTTVCNLSVSLAQAGARVIICDADLRRPSVSRVFGTDDGPGLTDLLLDPQADAASVLQPTAIPNLRVLTSGADHPARAEMLDSDTMKRRLAQLRELADIVIVDSPALLPVVDARLLATMCTGVLLVIDARARRDQALKAKAILDELHATVLGSVLNLTSSRNAGYQRYYRAASDRATRTRPDGFRGRVSGTWAVLSSGRNVKHSDANRLIVGRHRPPD